MEMLKYQRRLYVAGDAKVHGTARTRTTITPCTWPGGSYSSSYTNRVIIRGSRDISSGTYNPYSYCVNNPRIYE